MISIHIDVDNLWIYENEFGINLSADKDYIYTSALPLFLKLLKNNNAKATFMIVGKDLLMPNCQKFCNYAIKEGHEIANHTWSHPITFGTLSKEEKNMEVKKAHNVIKKKCNIIPVGFRGPGYYIDNGIIKCLSDLNYCYDSSILPGFASVIMTSYAKIKSKKNKDKTFGRFKYFFSPTKSYKLKNDLLELPISVFPSLRTPIHSTFAFMLGSSYQKNIINLIKRKPSYFLYLFHALDFVNEKDVENSNHLITLKYNLTQRLNYCENILIELRKASNGKILNTQRQLKT